MVGNQGWPSALRVKHMKHNKNALDCNALDCKLSSLSLSKKGVTLCVQFSIHCILIVQGLVLFSESHLSPFCCMHPTKVNSTAIQVILIVSKYCFRLDLFQHLSHGQMRSSYHFTLAPMTIVVMYCTGRSGDSCLIAQTIELVLPG